MTVLTQDISITESFTRLFYEQRSILEASSGKIMNALRESALEFFTKEGIPSRKNEQYKYTSNLLNQAFKREWRMFFERRNIQVPLEQIFRCDVPELKTHLVILLNGFYYPQGQKTDQLPDSVKIGSLSEFSLKNNELFASHYGNIADYQKDPLVALNTAFAQDGIFLHIPKNTVIEKPIQIINILLSDEEQLVQHRNLFVFDENSKADIFICDHSLIDKSFITNAVTEIYAGSNANVNVTKIQNEHNQCTKLSHIYVKQEKNSLVNNNTITLHGGLVRNNLYVSLDGEGAENQSLGLYLLDQKQHVDTFTSVEHKQPHCTSNQLYKGILDNESTGVFTGKVHVYPDAQKTLAYQKNNNLLITDDAKITSRPQLEIWADDVKCSHGATVGQLDEDAMFYLRSRGIGKEEARLLLMYAFANEIISKIPIVPVRERIDDMVNRRLRGDLTRCHNCAMNFG